MQNTDATVEQHMALQRLSVRVDQARRLEVIAREMSSRRSELHTVNDHFKHGRTWQLAVPIAKRHYDGDIYVTIVVTAGMVQQSLVDQIGRLEREQVQILASIR